MLTEREIALARIAYQDGLADGVEDETRLTAGDPGPRPSFMAWLESLWAKKSLAVLPPALTLEDLTSFASTQDGEFIDNGIDPETLGPHGQYYVDASLELTRRKAYSKSACAQLIAEARLRGEREGPALTYTTEPPTEANDGELWLYLSTYGGESCSRVKIVHEHRGTRLFIGGKSVYDMVQDGFLWMRLGLVEKPEPKP